MAVQFPVVGALGPGLTEVYSVGLAEVGFAIGLYFLPGVVIALPGSAIGARFGKRQVVGASLGLLAIGGTVMAVAPDWTLFLTGQLVAGLGGVMLNMLMTKMAADWFAGREISAAMGIFIISWPFGIALSLVLIPPVVRIFGLAVGIWGVAVLSAARYWPGYFRTPRGPPRARFIWVARFNWLHWSHFGDLCAQRK